MNKNDPLMGFNLIDGALSIKDCAGKETIIFESPMVAYEKFYRYWQLGVQASVDAEGEGETFTNSWCFNDSFRDHMIAALTAVGIENPTRYTPRQLEALLVTYDKGLGLIFQLHGQFPKTMKVSPKIPKTTHSTNLIQRVMFYGRSLATKAYLKFGPLVVF